VTASATMKYLPFARPVVDEAMVAEVADTLRSGWIASGPRVAEFEAALSTYHGMRPARVFTSATGALEVALQVCGIGPGDEVITSAMTFFSVGNMIRKCGAKAVFVDCDLETRNMTPDAVRRAMTSRTRAIIPTHFAGLACDMDGLLAIATERGVRVIEDAALAIGSRWKGKRIGSFGDIATFSFHPNKNITTIEGGAAIFPNAEEAVRAEALRFHGIRRLPDGTRDVDFPGGKFNLSDVSARLGIAQLARLDEWCALRRALADRYFERLGGSTRVALPARAPGGAAEAHSWNMFCIRLPLEHMRQTRKEFIDAMHARGIGIGISYEALHLTSLFRADGHREGEFPNAERIARETVTLPLHAAMNEDDVDRVCGALEELLP
jgi:dTDP-4-amino-4,6-dideoxygalactose transaminase